jgi:hypothetical protein
LYQLKYRDLINHHEKDRHNIKGPKNKIMTWKDEVSGSINEKHVYVRSRNDCIPEIIKELHPKIRVAEYNKLKKDDAFMDHAILACTDCALNIYNSTGRLGGVPEKAHRTDFGFVDTGNGPHPKVDVFVKKKITLGQLLHRNNVKWNTNPAVRKFAEAERNPIRSNIRKKNEIADLVYDESGMDLNPAGTIDCDNLLGFDTEFTDPNKKARSRSRATTSTHVTTGLGRNSRPYTLESRMRNTRHCSGTATYNHQANKTFDQVFGNSQPFDDFNTTAL